MLSTGWLDEADFGFAVEDDMQIADHAGRLQQGARRRRCAMTSRIICHKMNILTRQRPRASISGTCQQALRSTDPVHDYFTVLLPSVGYRGGNGRLM